MLQILLKFIFDFKLKAAGNKQLKYYHIFKSDSEHFQNLKRAVGHYI